MGAPLPFDEVFPEGPGGRKCYGMKEWLRFTKLINFG